MAMESSITCSQGVTLDQLRHCKCGLPLSFFDPKPLASLMRPSLSRVVRFSSLESGLRPRPMQKPSKSDSREEEFVRGDAAGPGDGRIRKPILSLCSQIEKLVFFKRYREAMELFEYLELEGSFDVGTSTLDGLISACIGLRSVQGAKRLFSYMIRIGYEFNTYMMNRVLLLHLKCGMLINARKLFDDMPHKDLVSWTTIIAGLVDSGIYGQAFGLFLEMWEEFSVGETRLFATVIRASSGMGIAALGQQLHSCAVRMGISDDMFVGCTLIDMYSKCGSIEDAQCVFDNMPEKTTVGWNSIIAGYALHGHSEEALNLYYEMQDSGAEMDHFTFSILARTCTRLASLDLASQVHAGLIRHGFGLDTVANTALVDFYSKWGKIENARHLFDSMPEKNVISWNAMLAGYGNRGQGEKALELFEQMIRVGMVPNHVTFLAVLSACGYSGLFEQGWEVFQSMSREYNIKPRPMHYACMIDLLGREGLLDEAFALIRGAPFKPTANMWAALLTACRAHENVELGRLAAEKLYGMEPEKLNNYIVLLNIYNSSGKVQEAEEVVQTLQRKGLTLRYTCTWIEINNKSNAFLPGDRCHAQTEEIYEKVDSLMEEISKRGFVRQEIHLLPDVDEEEARLASYHSEKLAIAFGLINSGDWAPLQLVQSHRICNDCHSAIKLISAVTRRRIVFRDASRFHHFKDGSCSCGDYW
ncbi:hypothetical protein MLD38_032680 [Melastoma candidum]|uniref:Uncharacterized protein n=1 Tax=Melastoma candidum TaxID=119954 RepID=A0ACB9M4H7_9MYRT|nr:hypothetical protein MLD38_032680 [Melastoma candidum]